MPESMIPTYFPRSAELVYGEELLTSRIGTPWQSDQVRNYQRKWLCRVTDNTLGANKIARSLGLRPFSSYATEDGKEWDINALLVGIHLEEPIDPQDGFHKVLVADYSTEMPAGGPVFSQFGIDAEGAQNNPETIPPDVEWDGDTIREAPETDLDGKPYTNTADHPYKPAVAFERGRAILVYTRNQLSYNNRKHTRYSFALNGDTFLGEAPETVQLFPPRAKLMWLGRRSYWRVTYRFRFNNPEGPKPINNVVAAAGGGPVAAALAHWDPLKAPLKKWQPRILDAGTMEYPPDHVPGDAKLVIPIYAGAHAVTEPVLLDGKGRRQTEKGPNGRLKPVYNEYREFIKIPFTPILVTGLAFPG